jgi:hypothetical protein
VSLDDPHSQRLKWLERYAIDGKWATNTSANGGWQDSLGVGPPPHDPGTLVTEADMERYSGARAMRDKLSKRDGLDLPECLKRPPKTERELGTARKFWGDTQAKAFIDQLNRAHDGKGHALFTAWFRQAFPRQRPGGGTLLVCLKSFHAEQIERRFQRDLEIVFTNPIEIVLVPETFDPSEGALAELRTAVSE